MKRKSAPDLDDAFAREVGDFESLEALTTAVRTDMTAHAERESDAEVRQKLVDEIVGANPFDVPPKIFPTRRSGARPRRSALPSTT